jgi:ATP-dependent DNA helicase DinG
VIEILAERAAALFVLFTSYATLRAGKPLPKWRLDYPIFVQGTMPRTQLLKQFRETPHSVLLATSSSGRASTSSATR